MKNARNYWFPVIAVSPLLIKLLNETFVYEKLKGSKVNKGIMTVIYAVLACITVMMVLYGDYAPDNTMFPEKAADYLDTLYSEDMVLYNCMNAGGYLELRGYQVFMDVRPELYDVYINRKENLLAECADGTFDKEQYEHFIEKYGFTHFILAKDSRFALYLEMCDEYTKVYEDNYENDTNYCIYVRN